MPTVTRILVATDFSLDSARAIAWGEELARHFAAEIVVLHVEEALSMVPGSDLFEVRRRGSEAELARMVAQLRGHGITARGLLRSGAAFDEIVEAARKEHTQVIVMGTHGRTGLSHLLMGSVAERVVRHAPCPVLTVRQPEEQER
jgi:universal stress protein A